MLPSGYRIERRLRISALWQLITTVVALTMSALVCMLLLWSAGADVGQSFAALWDGAFGTWRRVVETLVRATPLLLTALAVLVAFRARLWNIGAEGQLFAGAIASYWVYTLTPDLPAALLFIVLLLASAAGGAAYGGFAGYLKARLSVNEILSTVMLNYVIRFFLSYMLVEGSWRDRSSFYQQTPAVVDTAKFPMLIEGMRLHAGFVVALLAAVLVYVILFKTSFGFEIRAMGNNARTARFKGIDVGRMTILVMCLSGALAGLAGAGELFGLQHRLKPDVSTGFGFTGIIIAVVSGLNPIAAVAAAVLFGGLVNGGVRLQIFTGVPAAMISSIEAIVLLFFLIATFLSRYEIRKVEPDG